MQMFYTLSLLSIVLFLQVASLSGRPIPRKPGSLGRLGPPQRKTNLIPDANSKSCGRVSVYCLGSAINLPALRAHVFRRSFANSIEDPISGLKLDRTESDEFLHISNEPILMPSQLQLVGRQSFAISENYWVDMNDDNMSEEDQQAVAQAEERLLLASQDIVR